MFTVEPAVTAATAANTSTSAAAHAINNGVEVVNLMDSTVGGGGGGFSSSVLGKANNVGVTGKEEYDDRPVCGEKA